MMTDFLYRQGDTWPFVFTWTGIEDFTDVHCRQHIRHHRTQALMASISTEDHIQVYPDNYQVQSLIPPEITQNIPPGYYITDLEITLSHGFRISTDVILFQVVGDATHD